MDEPRAHIVFGTEATYERTDGDDEWLFESEDGAPRLFFASEHDGCEGDCVVGVEILWAGWECFSDVPEHGFSESPTQMAAAISEFCSSRGVITKNAPRFMLIATMTI